ncbi:hypothetical protein EBR96_02960 [bacterium]|nr:hypothetical protein [bacterium]
MIITAFLLTIDIAFLIPNLAKIGHGGWVPLALAGFIMLIMTTWNRGRSILAERLSAITSSLSDFLSLVHTDKPVRVPGIAVYMARDPRGTPPILAHNFRHNHVLHESLILLSVETDEVPNVPDSERYTIQELGDGIYRISMVFGFMDVPDIPKAIELVELNGEPINPLTVTYFLGRETILATPKTGMSLWREHLFAFLAKNSQRATLFFNIPSDQVIEIGIQVEL